MGVGLCWSVGMLCHQCGIMENKIDQHEDRRVPILWIFCFIFLKNRSLWGCGWGLVWNSRVLLRRLQASPSSWIQARNAALVKSYLWVLNCSYFLSMLFYYLHSFVSFMVESLPLSLQSLDRPLGPLQHLGFVLIMSSWICKLWQGLELYVVFGLDCIHVLYLCGDVCFFFGYCDFCGVYRCLYFYFGLISFCLRICIWWILVYNS